MADQQWRIEVDRARCMGSGVCIATAGAYFTMVDDRSSPRSKLVAPDDTVLAAAESCAVEAILVRTAGTGVIVAPE
ncbi:ferredoxin [Nocardia abscessus]|uniref:ferredoxin n=1 Tax=Nocardia abscessus TaxID=120957 RepID=UPI001894A97D|nr:ferredoxin [Nocardia abscessus]MBF6341376.1 ferredoxin [Nocardia abscessus]